jgi:hypothetical protein
MDVYGTTLGCASLAKGNWWQQDKSMVGDNDLLFFSSCLKRANYLCSLDWKILFNLSLVYCSMMQFASAYTFMSSALNLNPRNKMLLMGLASKHHTYPYTSFQLS